MYHLSGWSNKRVSSYKDHMYLMHAYCNMLDFFSTLYLCSWLGNVKHIISTIIGWLLVRSGHTGYKLRDSPWNILNGAIYMAVGSRPSEICTLFWFLLFIAVQTFKSSGIPFRWASFCLLARTQSVLVKDENSMLGKGSFLWCKYVYIFYTCVLIQTSKYAILPRHLSSVWVKVVVCLVKDQLINHVAVGVLQLKTN